MIKTLLGILALAAPVYAGTWWLVYSFAAPMVDPVVDANMATKCISTACLLTLVIAIENVSRERLFSTAIDPIHGTETAYLKFAQRLLASNLEQFVVFAVGLFALGTLITDQRVVVATTVTWVLSRYVFWIAYAKGSQFRTAGLIGMIQSYIVLVYVTYKTSPYAVALFLITIASITYNAYKRNQAPKRLS